MRREPRALDVGRPRRVAASTAPSWREHSHAERAQPNYATCSKDHVFSVASPHVDPLAWADVDGACPHCLREKRYKAEDEEAVRRLEEFREGVRELEV